MIREKLSLILTPASWGYVLFIFVIAFIFGFLYRFILRMMVKSGPRKVQKNIDTKGRRNRAMIGLGLLILAITTTWSPWLIFFSGFSFFEAIFSWCGFNAAIGRNTCPIE